MFLIWCCHGGYDGCSMAHPPVYTCIMMTSRPENTFCITVPLWGDSLVDSFPKWVSIAEVWCFNVVSLNKLLNKHLWSVTWSTMMLMLMSSLFNIHTCTYIHHEVLLSAADIIKTQPYAYLKGYIMSLYSQQWNSWIEPLKKFISH